MATFLEHAIDVADILGIRGAGGTLSAEDAGIIQGVSRSVFAELATNIYVVQDEDDIPDEAREALAQRVAVDAASRFGTTAAALASMGVTRESSEWRLRRVTAPRRTRKILQMDRF